MVVGDSPSESDNSLDRLESRTTPTVTGPEVYCSVPHYTHAEEFVHNLPYIVMVLLGSTIMVVGTDATVLGWLFGTSYLAYGVGGVFWIMLFVCPYCHFWGTRQCPCGYGQVASTLRARKDYDRFTAQFKKHMTVIVPLWFLPILAGIAILSVDLSWLLLALLVVFVLDSFVVLPVLSTRWGCARFGRKATCPWMNRCGAVSRK